MNTVKLNNGAEEHEGLVNITMLHLKALIEDQPIAFFELVEKCRNRNHKLFGVTGKVLKDLSLIESDENIHSSIKNIILSATEGKGLNLTLINPIR